MSIFKKAKPSPVSNQVIRTPLVPYDAPPIIRQSLDLTDWEKQCLQEFGEEMLKPLFPTVFATNPSTVFFPLPIFPKAEWDKVTQELVVTVDLTVIKYNHVDESLFNSEIALKLHEIQQVIKGKANFCRLVKMIGDSSISTNP